MDSIYHADFIKHGSINPLKEKKCESLGEQHHRAGPLAFRRGGHLPGS